jgi:ABC-type lipoprotein release transport system permease subunit
MWGEGVLALGCRMLLRKRGTTLSIIVVALLAAILASANSIINYVDLQVEAFGRLVSPGRTYLILNGNSTSIMDRWVDVAWKLCGFSYVEHMLPQKILTVNLTVESISRMVQVRGVEDVDVFLKVRGAYVNGAENWTEVNVGEILAGALSISIGGEVNLSFGVRQVRVVGVFRSRTRSDAELVVPMETARRLAGNDDKLSFIEFALKEGVGMLEAVNEIKRLLPENVKLIQAQQMGGFAQQMSMQTLIFLNVWSTAVYAAIAASYVIATRLIVELKYELAMLRALGAKKIIPLTLIFTYIAAVAFIGSMLGISLGTAGTRAASTILRWIMPSAGITPFLEVEQAVRTLLLTFASSILGCMHPAVKHEICGAAAVRRKRIESLRDE